MHTQFLTRHYGEIATRETPQVLTRSSLYAE